MIYFTSDTHFYHTNIIKYCNRPFNNTHEMNETMIENWNKIVTEKDIIWHLGDFCFNRYENPETIFNRLNGQKHLVMGNHDRLGVMKNLGWKIIVQNYELKVFGKSIWLSHYAHRTWNKSFHGAWHLYGHSHNTLPGYGLSFDIGVDAWNFSPISFEEVEGKMKNLTPCEGKNV